MAPRRLGLAPFAAALGRPPRPRPPGAGGLWFAAATYGAVTARRLPLAAGAVPGRGGGHGRAPRARIGFGDARGGWRRAAPRWVLEAAALVWAFSESARREILLRASPKAIAVVAAGGRHGLFRPADDQPRERLVVSTCAAISPLTIVQKGLDRLVAAARQAPDIQVVVTGRCRREAPRRCGAFVAGAPANVTFAGHVSREALRALYARAAVVAQLSRHEGFGVAAAEGLAMGCAVVTSALPAFDEVVGGPGHCRVADDAPPEAVAAVLREAMAAPPAAFALGRGRSAVWWRCARGGLGSLARRRRPDRASTLMCGIALTIDWTGDGVAPARLARMTQALARRGPDDEAYVVGDWETGPRHAARRAGDRPGGAAAAAHRGCRRPLVDRRRRPPARHPRSRRRRPHADDRRPRALAGLQRRALRRRRSARRAARRRPRVRDDRRRRGAARGLARLGPGVPVAAVGHVGVRDLGRAATAALVRPRRARHQAAVRRRPPGRLLVASTPGAIIAALGARPGAHAGRRSPSTSPPASSITGPRPASPASVASAPAASSSCTDGRVVERRWADATPPTPRPSSTSIGSTGSTTRSTAPSPPTSKAIGRSARR